MSDQVENNKPAKKQAMKGMDIMGMFGIVIQKDEDIISEVYRQMKPYMVVDTNPKNTKVKYQTAHDPYAISCVPVYKNIDIRGGSIEALLNSVMETLEMHNMGIESIVGTEYAVIVPEYTHVFRMQLTEDVRFRVTMFRDRKLVSYVGGIELDFYTPCLLHYGNEKCKKVQMYKTIPNEEMGVGDIRFPKKENARKK